MSIERCDKHGYSYDTDLIELCPHCNVNHPAATPGAQGEPVDAWAKISLALGETPEGILRRAVVNIASLNPLTTASPQEIAKTALKAVDALRNASPQPQAPAQESAAEQVPDVTITLAVPESAKFRQSGYEQPAAKGGTPLTDALVTHIDCYAQSYAAMIKDARTVLCASVAWEIRSNIMPAVKTTVGDLESKLAAVQRELAEAQESINWWMAAKDRAERAALTRRDAGDAELVARLLDMHASIVEYDDGDESDLATLLRKAAAALSGRKDGGNEKAR